MKKRKKRIDEAYDFFELEYEYDDYVMSFKVYEIIAITMENEIDEKELYLSGYIKWDGCSNLEFNDNLHLCGCIYWKKHVKLMEEIYRTAQDCISNFDESQRWE